MIFMTPPPQGLCRSGVGFFKSEAEADAALSLRWLCRPHSLARLEAVPSRPRRGNSGLLKAVFAL